MSRPFYPEEPTVPPGLRRDRTLLERLDALLNSQALIFSAYHRHTVRKAIEAIEWIHDIR